MGDSLPGGWIRLLRRRWRAGGALFVVVSAAGVSMVLLGRSVYRAEARLRLGEPPPMSGVSPTAGFFGLLRMGGDPFSNDLELLASRTLAEQVVDDAALHVRLVAPRNLHRDTLLVALRADRTTGRATFTVRWIDDDVVVTTPQHPTVRVRVGEEAVFGGVRAVFRPWREGMPREVKVKTMPHAQAARELGGRLTVERTRREANVVRIRYQSADPGLTRDVVASVVDRFVAVRTRIMQRESGETVDSLRGVALRTRAELAAAEDSLEAVQRRTGMIAPEAQAEAFIERYAELVTRLEAARIEQRALNDAVTRSLATDEAAAAWTALLAYPRFLENPTIGEMLTAVTTLEQRRRELARRRTENNLELRAVLDQLEYLDGSLRTLAVDFRSTLDGEVRALEAQVSALDAELAGVPTRAIEFGRRQRELRVLSEMVVVTEARLRQEELRQALTFANVQVIDPAALRDRPIWPRRKLGPAIALFIAGVTSLLGMVVIDRADRSLRTASQVRAALNAPVLAVARARGDHVTIPRDDVAAMLRRAVIEPGGCVRFVITDAPGGRCAMPVARAIAAESALSRDAFDSTSRMDAPPGLAGPVLVPHPEVLPAVDGFGAAAAVAARRLPVIVAVEAGATAETALNVVAELLHEAGAEVAGAVLVCRRAGEAAEVWT